MAREGSVTWGKEPSTLGADRVSMGPEHEGWGLRTESGQGRLGYKFSWRAVTSRLTTKQKPECCPRCLLPHSSSRGPDVASPSSVLDPGPPLPAHTPYHPAWGVTGFHSAECCSTARPVPAAPALLLPRVLRPAHGRSGALTLQLFPEMRKQDKERRQGSGSGGFSGPWMALGPTLRHWPCRLDVWSR